MVTAEKLTKSKDKLRVAFVLRDSTPAYANALRRSIIANVPTLAIEDVEMYENNSALYDEVIAHRLGLLPLTTDLSSYILPTGDDGVSRASSEVKLSLEAKGPCTVYASELKSKDAKVKCAFPQTPIVKLLKNQTIKFEATAVLGQGKVHSKWTPAAVFYQNLPVIEDGSKKIELEPKDVVDAKVFELFVKEDGSLSIPVAKVQNPKISQSQNDFLFVVESFGQLKPEEIIAEALSQLDKQIDAFTEEIQTL
jgi:DNA-directed RNA polymerase subunit D